ncbi:MAG: histidine kinase dimerization/phospho-acceptor domain-containing protein, partial [Cyanobacteria bacterium J06633_23]
MSAELLSQEVPLSHVRHELRTPINGILGYSEMLLEERQGCDNSTIITPLKKIRACGQRLLSLINSALSE